MRLIFEAQGIMNHDQPLTLNQRAAGSTPTRPTRLNEARL